MISKNKTLFSILLISIYLPAFNANGQTMPDSVIILKNFYSNMFCNDTVECDSLFKTQKFVFKKSINSYESENTSADFSLISDLIKEINTRQNLSNSLNRYKIDTNWIKNNPGTVLKISPYAGRFSWNSQQEKFIYKELVKVSHYEKGLSEYLNDGCCYTMHQNSRYQYVIKFYNKNHLVNQLTSRKFVWGYMYPWIDIKNSNLYSFKIESILNNILNSGRNISEPLLGRRLLSKLSDRILEIYSDTLNKLAPYTFEKEINDLRRSFKVTSFDKMTGYGGYHGEGPLIKIILKTPEMLPNVSIEFLASISHNTIYSRDSVINNYQSLVTRIQTIKFISDYLSANPQDNLYILYFDNKTINQYNIDGVNGKPEEWHHQDEYTKSLNWYKKNNIKPSFDISEAKRIFERNYCGCNYRFQEDFIKQAVMFIIDDEKGNHSRWFLLPDNTVLLYLTEGRKKVINNYFIQTGMNYPCARFDNSGVLIKKVDE